MSQFDYTSASYEKTAEGLYETHLALRNTVVAIITFPNEFLAKEYSDFKNAQSGALTSPSLSGFTPVYKPAGFVRNVPTPVPAPVTPPPAPDPLPEPSFADALAAEADADPGPTHDPALEQVEVAPPPKPLMKLANGEVDRVWEGLDEPKHDREAELKETITDDVRKQLDEAQAEVAAAKAEPTVESVEPEHHDPPAITVTTGIPGVVEPKPQPPPRRGAKTAKNGS